MGNVSLKVLEKSLNFWCEKGYEPCTNRGDATHVQLAFSCLPVCSFGSQCVDKLGPTRSLPLLKHGHILVSIF